MRIINRLTYSAAAAFACLSLSCSSGEVESSGALGNDAIENTEQSIVLTPGFQHQIVASGLSGPTAMDQAPDGRFFVAEKTGAVRVVKNGALLSQPFTSFTVDTVGERGLVGLTLDPNFASNGYVYVFYNTATGGLHNRVSRLTASGDVALAGSETVLVEFPALTASIHVSGALHFGNDGKLYVAHGDNDMQSRSQDLNNPFGKLLRFNPDGSIPTDNPFYNTSTGLARATWSYGLRNTFTFAISKNTGKIFGNDVGGGGPEEINNLVAGSNYGHGGGPAPVSPVHSYPRDGGRCAVTGGVFYESSVANFPNSYQGKYFFSDYCAGQIWFMNQDGTGVTSFADDSNGELNNPVDLDVGLDGSLYYLQRGSGAKIGRIYNPQPPCSTNADCSDGNVCTGIEQCVNNACQNGSPLTCNDSDPCTTNSCNPSSGCNYPDNGLCCAVAADCNDGNTCTTDSCVGQFCQNVDNGSCNQCVKIRSQRTNNYLVLDGTNQALPTGSQAAAQIFEKIPAGAGFKFRNTTNSSYMRVLANNLTVDVADSSAVTFTEYDCSSAGLYPGGKGYASPTGTAPHWKATTAAGPIQSENAGNGGSCVAGNATSWERFYPEVVTCPSSGPTCGDSTCNGTETCSTCAADCGACSTCGNGTCGSGESCSNCPADCGACASCGDGTCNGSETCSTCAADCGSCSAATRYQAEASTHVNSTLANEAASSGGQYVDGNAGANLTWTIASSGGNATLEFAIRSPSGVRTLGVFVNGSKVGTASTTTIRPTWAERSVNATLVAGNNTVELRDSENTAEPDIDYLDVTVTGGPTCGDGTCNGTESCSTCAADCGACATCGDGTCNGTETCSTCATDCGACSTPTRYQAEASTFINSIVANEAASSGGQYVDGNAGANLTWTVPSTGGSATLDFAIRAPSGIRTLGVFVNGSKVGAVSTTTIRPTWAERSVSATLVSGSNTIELRDSENTTEPDIDYLDLTVTTAASTCGDAACSGSETCSSCPSDCNTCTGGQLGLDTRPANAACVAGNGLTDPPLLLSEHPCVVVVTNAPVFTPGVIPYSITEPFWSDSALKTRFLALPDGATFAVQSDGDWNLPPGAVTIKNFQWQGQYFETRFFVRFTDGSYGAYTYMWNDTQDEAYLVDPILGDSKLLAGDHIWNYPTEAECFQCHTNVAGFSLGLETRQLNVSQLYPSTGRNANQFDTLNGIGMLSSSPARLPPFPGHNQVAVSLQQRAEAYLHVNCANCHRPGGPGYGTADYRYDTSFGAMNACNQASILTAFPDLDLIEPGDHSTSVVWLRMSQRDANFMPPLGSILPDADGATLLQEWIDQLTVCPAP